MQKKEHESDGKRNRLPKQNTEIPLKQAEMQRERVKLSCSLSWQKMSRIARNQYCVLTRRRTRKR